MIDRYTRPEMGHIFSLENKYAIWQEIEVLACEAQAELGKIGISKDEAQWIRDHANFEKAKVDEIEEVTRHDVIAFLTNMKEYIDADVPEGDPKPSRWVHYGMTSSDLGDTALCYQLTQACDLIIEDVKKLGEICKRRAFEERNTLCAGRTHGIHAEPMTFGMKFGSWAWELKRDLDRLEDARKNVAFGAISGAVGTYSSIEPFVEEYVCEHLGLVHDPLSTQVISRDHHAYLAGVLATTAATCEVDGVRTYTAKVTFEGKEYTDTKTEVIPATGHAYGAPVWKWNDDFTASATFTCGNDASHVETVNATVTNEVTTEATCKVDGVRTYTAKVTFEGKEYTDTKTETIPATSHDTELVGAKDATCAEDGYTGNEVCKVCQTVVKQGEVIPALGHDYKDGKCSRCGAEEPTTPVEPGKPQQPEKPTTPDTPATGDSSNMTALWVVLAVAGLGIIALVVLLVTKRSKKQNG